MTDTNKEEILFYGQKRPEASHEGHDILQEFPSI